DIFGASIYRSRRADELRNQPDGCVPSNGCLYRPHSQGREARGPASYTVHEVRAGHQCRERPDAPPHRTGQAARGRRRGDRVKRREFITLLGGAATAWPFAVRAQPADRMRKIGVLLSGTADDAVFQTWVGAFLQGLAQSGWVVGRDVRIETRWA